MEIIILPKSLGRKRMSLVFGSPVLRDYACKKPVACLMVPKELESSCIMKVFLLNTVGNIIFALSQ